MRKLRSIFETQDMRIILRLADMYYRQANGQIRGAYTPNRTALALKRAAALLKKMEIIQYTGEPLEIVREEDVLKKPRL